MVTANRGIWVPGSWALVLAGGEGSRLHELTRAPNGLPIPKQFCSLRGGPSLLALALARAGSVVPAVQTCAVVAAQHRWWWGTALSRLPKENVFVQPDNKGTAYGILLALLQLEQRDPNATVVVLPADHHIRDEPLFARSLRHIAELATHSSDTIYLLGCEPDDPPDLELGYVVPANRRSAKPARVAAFVEKPDAMRARRLIRSGALCHMFVLAGRLPTLLELYARAHAGSVDVLRQAIGGRPRRMPDSVALADAYRQLPVLDFSQDLLESQTSLLQVLAVPACGWNDLATPRRVAQTLRELPAIPERPAEPIAGGILSLGDQLSRLDLERSGRL